MRHMPNQVLVTRMPEAIADSFRFVVKLAAESLKRSDQLRFTVRAPLHVFQRCVAKVLKPTPFMPEQPKLSSFLRNIWRVVPPLGKIPLRNFAELSHPVVKPLGEVSNA